jgi:hypothetical protein
MSTMRCVVAALVAGGLGAAVVTAAQEGAGAPPGPGAEHKMLEKYVGTWECDVEMSSPGAAAEKSKAKSTAKLGCGGMWLVTDFEGTMMGGPFTGHEVTGFDPATKKYQFVWVDSWTAKPVIGEGTFDAASKTMTATMNGSDMTGAPATWRQVEVWKDADTREWAMYQKGPDGAEHPMIKITYHRKK